MFSIFRYLTIILIYHRCTMRPMKKDTLFGTALLTTAILGLSLASVNSISSVFASIDQSALQSVDLHLEECIKALQAGNAESALTHCELSDQELDPLLQNTTG
jgi:hypothetical protein